MSYDMTVAFLNKYCSYSRASIYIMFDDIDINWEWERHEVKEFDLSLKAGMNLFQLQDKFNRTQEEIVLMTIDRDMRCKLVRDENQGPYIMMEDVIINWFWDMKDVVMFDVYHRMGMSRQQLAEKFNRHEAEIIIMTFDRAMKDKL